ncbi:cysteine desulfuration protein SufE [Plasmodium gonderi]|uniref:Cysteine desulfuration protein SufE n=1 Tax=Plasmodium gonderi TaxID=77519 RepID=A0A1Y1JAK2_PLAGO|nr:cysteine desulfuration protein SufE [Plasmodium gonderi]GAW79551.1 cysteine desulfuration protein SufE [Plasmodium gonderi]
MNKKEIKNICFIYLQIICFCSVLINSMGHGKYNTKKENSLIIIKKETLCGEKKTHKTKCYPWLYLKNCELRNRERRNKYLKDIFNQLTGNHSPENSNIEYYSLTPKLKKTVQFFQALPNNPYRKSQEVILLGRKCPPMPDELKNRQNQVLGCQSTVYIHPKVESGDGQKIISWLGDSDGLLTKGIVYILIDGLSGYPPEEILQVNPNFITLTGISEFLTMSRINGYLNIMNKIKAFSTAIMENKEY